MVNKVRVTIAGAPYAIATTDSEKYIASLAKRLDEDITKLLDTNENLSVTKAAVFCAMDYLDEYKKSTGSAENMRSQIQDYIADAARAKLAEDKAKAENETLRRENDALREQLARLQAKQKAETALSRYAQGEAFDAIGEDMEGTYDHAANVTNGTSDMLTWAFDDARQEGDTTVAAYGEKGYYAVLFHSRSRNDYHAVSVRHILVDSEEKANELLQQYNDGEKTEDAFAALAVANSTDPGSASNGGLYSNIYKGEMVPSFEDWCFDPARQSGDTGIVESSNGYHVMYFVETNPQPYWYYKADLDLKNDAYNEWYAAITDGVEAEQLSGMKYVG